MAYAMLTEWADADGRARLDSLLNAPLARANPVEDLAVRRAEMARLRQLGLAGR